MIERSRFDRRAAAQERGLETDPEIHQEMCKCSTNIAENVAILEKKSTQPIHTELRNNYRKARRGRLKKIIKNQ